MLRPVNAGNSAIDYGDIPTEVKVSPLTLTMIVNRCPPVTFWTSHPLNWLIRQLQYKFLSYSSGDHLQDAQGNYYLFALKQPIEESRTIKWENTNLEYGNIVIDSEKTSTGVILSGVLRLVQS